jgi:hypothetical protein
MKKETDIAPAVEMADDVSASTMQPSTMTQSLNGKAGTGSAIIMRFRYAFIRESRDNAALKASRCS